MAGGGGEDADSRLASGRGGIRGLVGWQGGDPGERAVLGILDRRREQGRPQRRGVRNRQDARSPAPAHRLHEGGSRGVGSGRGQRPRQCPETRRAVSGGDGGRRPMAARAAPFPRRPDLRADRPGRVRGLGAAPGDDDARAAVHARRPRDRRRLRRLSGGRLGARGTACQPRSFRHSRRPVERQEHRADRQREVRWMERVGEHAHGPGSSRQPAGGFGRAPGVGHARLVAACEAGCAHGGMVRFRLGGHSGVCGAG